MSEWKEAACLILFSKGDQRSLKSSDNEFKLLMAKRSQQSSLYASAYVFPGGHLELNDFSSRWWDVFTNAGFSRQDILKVSNRIKGKRPPIMSKCLLLKSYPNTTDILPIEIALRICAIRETFEETGILLVTSKVHSSNKETVVQESDLQAWQKQCYHNADQFINLCQHLKVAPNIWDLYEWWNWLTPNIAGHKRFDTIFYICFVNECPPSYSDGQEISSLQWISPIEMLKRQDQNEAFLAPPQVYELSRLATFKSYQHLKEFVEKREAFGIVRWLPQVSVFTDGAALILPGDDLYFSSEIAKSSSNASARVPSLSEERSKLGCFNRIELQLPSAKAYCNIIINCGQCSPITYPQTGPVLLSSL